MNILEVLLSVTIVCSAIQVVCAFLLLAIRKAQAAPREVGVRAIVLGDGVGDDQLGWLVAEGARGRYDSLVHAALAAVHYRGDERPVELDSASGIRFSWGSVKPSVDDTACCGTYVATFGDQPPGETVEIWYDIDTIPLEGMPYPFFHIRDIRKQRPRT